MTPDDWTDAARRQIQQDGQRLPGVQPPPTSDWPKPPAGGWLYRVAYTDKNQRTQQRLHRNEQKARNFAIAVLLSGGNPRLHRAKLSRWQELDPLDGRWTP